MSTSLLMMQGAGVACSYGTLTQALFAGCATGLSVLNQKADVSLEDGQGNLLQAWQGPVPGCTGSPGQRMAWLVERAVESLAQVQNPGLALGGPAKAMAYITLPGESAARAGLFDLDALARSVREHIGVAAVEFDRGPGSLERVLDAAAEVLRKGQVERCLVGGVDSLLNGQSAEEMRAAGQLRLYGDEDGFGLGEGAAFAMVTADNGEAGGAWLSWMGAAEPDEGKASQEALGGCLLAAGPLAHEGVDVVVHDLDVTEGGAMEWNQVTAGLWPARLDEASRLAVQVGELAEAAQVAETIPETLGVCSLIGHVGAASPWLRLAAGWERLRFEHAPVSRVLVLDDSEPGWRSAFLLHRATAGRGDGAMAGVEAGVE